MNIDDLKKKISDLESERDRLRIRVEGQKIQLNGTFGKLGSPHSPLYAPKLLSATTLTGQLSVLMLIDRAEAAGLPVVSANTDGVVFRYQRSRKSDLDAVVAEWEATTGFEIERTPYRALYSSSVNSYVAIKEDGKEKRKGPISDPWTEGHLRGQMMKNPQMTVCGEAAVRYLADGVSPEDTVRACRDPRRFITVVKVKDGGIWRGVKLGRAVRYYWSTDGDAITYPNGNKVGKADGARPMMELTDRLPDDVDVSRYIAEAEKMIVDFGDSTYGFR